MPQSADFMLEPRGKPYLKSRPDIHFSISHSGAMAMCALHDSPVGADIEMRRAVGEGVAERVMTAEELHIYADAPDKQVLFFQIWTLKEAYLKYCGAGLGKSMSSVTIYPSADGIVTDTGCEFWMTEPGSGYQASVCAKIGTPSQFFMVDSRQLSDF